MRQNYKFLISYDGSRYKGWEHQPGTDLTIQGKLENVLSRLVYGDAWDASETPAVEIFGAGRTDAGVHALGMTASAAFEVPKSRRTGRTMTADEIRDYMNHYLPEDILVREVTEAEERFHARYNARGKTYRYVCYIGRDKPVFDRKYVYTLDTRPDGKPLKRDAEGRIQLDRNAMREAAAVLEGTHDYAAFCSNPRMKKSTVRQIFRITIRQEGDRLHFIYHGSGFLQHMVRILTGTILEAGLGERTVESITEVMETKDRALAGFTAPACGLTLIKVDY